MSHQKKPTPVGADARSAYENLVKACVKPLNKFTPLVASARSIPAAKEPASAQVATATPCSYPPAAKLQPNTSTIQKEHAMTNHNSSPKPSALRVHLIATITANPGIKKQDLIADALKQFPEEFEAHVFKTLQNMQYVSKVIRAEGEIHNRTYVLFGAPETVVPPIVKKQETPAPEAEKAKPVAVKPRAEQKPHAAAQLAEEQDDDITIFIDNKNCLCISTTHRDFELNSRQTAELQRFLARIDQPKPPPLLSRLFGRA